MLNPQLQLQLTTSRLEYDELVPKDNELRRMADLCDFSFIYEELASKYCHDNGRMAINPILLFKYLVLKMYSGLSDVDVVKHSLYDLSYKYFLGLEPNEKNLIHPTSLTKFRRQRLKDANLMQLLISKTVQLAKDNNIKLSGVLIVDSTHTNACYTLHKPIEVLRMREKNLLKALADIEEQYLPDMPQRNNPDYDLNTEVEYCLQLIDYLRKNVATQLQSKVQERCNILEESLQDLEADGEIALDKEARIGHKSPTRTFNGYKTHLGVDKDSRLITAAIVTTGEKADGPELQGLIEQTEAVGAEVNAVIGDTAYSLTDNLAMCKEKNIPLYSKLHPIISDGTRKDNQGFYLNKDSDLMVCPQGHQALRKTQIKHTQTNKDNGKTYTNDRYVFYFDIEKCKTCPLREGCYSGGKYKTFSVSIEKEAHKEQRAFQKTDEFKEAYRERYQVEAKNGELKTRYGYDKAESYGLQRMQLQSSVAVFVCNMTRILRKIQ